MVSTQLVGQCGVSMVARAARGAVPSCMAVETVILSRAAMMNKRHP